MLLWLPSLVYAFACPPTVQEADALPAEDPRWAQTVLVVFKTERRLGVYRAGKLLTDACWSVALAHGYVPGHKQAQGDLRTPEGWSRISDRPWSQYYGALTVHYPDAEDAARGLERGQISRADHDAIVSAERTGRLPPSTTPLGGNIVIHGGGGRSDWTLGCVAMENDAIDAMRALLPGSKKGWVLVLP